MGLDSSASVVGSLTAGRSHVDDLSDEDVAKMLAAGFEPTTDAATGSLLPFTMKGGTGSSS